MYKFEVVQNVLYIPLNPPAPPWTQPIVTYSAYLENNSLLPTHIPLNTNYFDPLPFPKNYSQLPTHIPLKTTHFDPLPSPANNS